MKTTLLWTAILALMPLILTGATAGTRKKVVAYAPNWGDVTALTAKIDYAKITHLNIAFENPVDDAGALSVTAGVDTVVTRAHARGVKVLVSIGGGSASTNPEMQKRYFALISKPRRAAFAIALADYVAAHKFDGLDVDIEGPSINADYGPFIIDLAKALKTRGKLLTAALSQGYGGDKVPAAALALFDFVNIMAYDATGPWAKDRPGQHSSFEHAKSSIAYWTGRGLPKSRAVLGVPFYGYGFGSAYRTRDYPYSEIVATYPGAEKADQVGATIWYNGLATMRAKAKYVVDQGLAGIMIWSIDADAAGNLSLLSAIHSDLTQPAMASKPAARSK